MHDTSPGLSRDARATSIRPRAIHAGARSLLVGAALSLAPVALSVSGGGGLAFAPSSAAAQGLPDRIIDRWLVTSAAPVAADAGYPLHLEGERIFPDRDEEIGPGYWDLVRGESPGAGVRIAALAGSADAALAHVYVKAPVDGDLLLGLREPECEGADLWLNGQDVPLADRRPVRLAAGWNTLLLGLPADCGPNLSVELLRSDGPADEEARPLEPSRLRLQASRPPGVRPNYPAPTVTLDTPRPAGLVWRAGSDRLGARIEYALTAWGARGMDGEAGGRGVRERPDERRDEPPAVDLAGEWRITLYTPTGIERLRGILRMEPQGRLEGRLRGDRISGDIRDGWVSADRFGWTLRVPAARGSADIIFEGVLRDGEMEGTLDFGGFRDFDTRFEGTRIGGEDAAGPDRAPDRADEPPAGPPGRGARPPGLPPRGARDAPEGEDQGHGPSAERRARFEAMARQLLPPGPPPPPAPRSASIELDIDGTDLTGAAQDLTPGVPARQGGEIPFEDARDAALDDEGVEATISWSGGKREVVGPLRAHEVLEAFHAPIVLTAAEGTFRVPEALDGFTLRVLDGDWSVDGRPLEGGLLCSPCQRGRRLDIRVTGTTEPRVRIADPGYPEARAAGAGPDAGEWLRTLKRNRGDYRELGEEAVRRP